LTMKKQNILLLVVGAVFLAAISSSCTTPGNAVAKKGGAYAQGSIVGDNNTMILGAQGQYRKKSSGDSRMSSGMVAAVPVSRSSSSSGYTRSTGDSVVSTRKVAGGTAVRRQVGTEQFTVARGDGTIIPPHAKKVSTTYVGRWRGDERRGPNGELVGDVIETVEHDVE